MPCSNKYGDLTNNFNDIIKNNKKFPREDGGNKFVNGLMPVKQQKQTNLQGFKIPVKPKILDLDDDMGNLEEEGPSK